MQVLALGLSRCGTESLKLALEELGYQGVYHGFELTGSHSVSWCKLLDRKFKGASITREDFDRVIGDFEAVTDVPCNMLADDMIAAYPDAKVILNRRKDMDAWDRSCRETLCRVLRDSYRLKALALFCADYFWLRQFTMRMISDYFKGSFERHGKEVYVEHYRKLEDILGGSSRGRYLSWTVEAGWEPLCQFLDKPVPLTPFPSGNAPAAFVARINKRRISHIQTAKRNLSIILGTLVFTGVAVGLVYKQYGQCCRE